MFTERLLQAAMHAGVEATPTEIAKSLGIKNRQTTFKWFHGTTPEGMMIAHIAESWKVNPIWLATGQGEMIQSPSDTGLNNEERDIIRVYRSAHPQRRKVLYTMVKALGKAIVIASLSVPALMPQPAEAAFNIINSAEKFSAKCMNIMHIVSQWLAMIVGRRIFKLS